MNPFKAIGKGITAVGKGVAVVVTAPVAAAKRGVEKTMVEMVKGVVRHVLTGLSGWLLAGGASGDDVQAVIGGAVGLVGVVWSVMKNKQAHTA